MTETASPLTVADNPEQSRYDGRLDGNVIAFTEYALRDDRIVFLHTEVDPAFEGRGFGGMLASSALDDVRARGLRVVARCPFIASYIRRHREYADLLARTSLGGSTDEPPT